MKQTIKRRIIDVAWIVAGVLLAAVFMWTLAEGKESAEAAQYEKPCCRYCYELWLEKEGE